MMCNKLEHSRLYHVVSLSSKHAVSIDSSIHRILVIEYMSMISDNLTSEQQLKCEYTNPSNSVMILRSNMRRHQGRTCAGHAQEHTRTITGYMKVILSSQDIVNHWGHYLSNGRGDYKFGQNVGGIFVIPPIHLKFVKCAPCPTI